MPQSEIAQQSAGRELDLRVHGELFDREIFTLDAMKAEAESVWRDQPQCRVFMRGFTAMPTSDAGWLFVQMIPSYSSTPEGAALVLAEIARRNLGDEFTRALMRIIDPRRFDCLSPPEIFSLLTASPEQVCRAALHSLASKKGE